MMFNTALIFIKPDSTHAFNTVKVLHKHLASVNILTKIIATQDTISHFQQHFPDIEAVTFSDVNENLDMVAFSVGGDGTFLFSIQQICTKPIPIIGINEGSRGFLTPFNPEDIPALVSNIQTESLHLQDVPLWKVKHPSLKKPIFFINELVLQRHAHGKMIRFNVATKNFGSFNGRADGLIISTGTGSTAYNMTAGGSIFHPGIRALSLTSICPHNLKHKPVIIPAEEITLTLQNDNAGICYDGLNAGTLDAEESLVITQAQHSLKIATPGQTSYLNILDQKLF